MLKLLAVFSLLGAGFSTPVELSPGDRYDILARGGRNNVERKPMTRADIELSVSEIAAQLLTNPPPGSIASSTPHTELVKDPENEAKVVDHIKGLLSDIYTNSIIQDKQVGADKESGEYELAELNNQDQNTSVVLEESDEESVDEMIAEEDDQLMMENRPTILQVFTKLDQSQVQDKEQLLKVISDMQAEKDATELMVEGVTESEFFKDIEVNTYAAVEPTTTTTTTTTTQPTTTTQTTTTTTESTTTTTEDPGLLGRVGIIVNNGFGGVINGLANAANSFTSGGLFGGAANSPLWIPLGRRKRSVSQIDLLSPASLKTNSRSKWNPSLNSGNSFSY